MLSAPGVTVTLRPISEVEIARAEEKGLRAPEFAKGSATIKLDPTADHLEAFESISQRRLPESSPRELLGTRWVDEEGNLMGGEIVHADHLSADLRRWLENVQAGLHGAIRAVFDATAWRMALDGPRDPVSFGRAYWSLDGKQWEHFPTGQTSVVVSSVGQYQLHAARRSDIQALLDSGRTEPLAHALWREANAQSGSHPRSAVLIGVAALEVGLKQFAASRVPDADWLLREAPSPPVVKMLAKFLPDLPPIEEGGGQFRRPSKAILTIVEEGIELRNQIAHKGVEQDPSNATVTKILSTVRDLLWRFDLADGIDWAERYVEGDHE